MSESTEKLFKLLNKRGYTDDFFAEVTALIATGADVNYRQEKYPFETILCRALDDWNEQHVLRMVQMLIEHGADVNQPADTFYPIWFAIQKNFPLVVDLLLTSGANEDLDDALRHAIENNNLAIVNKLIAHKINFHYHLARGECFLIYCNEPYRCSKNPEDLAGLEIAKRLLDSGVDPNGFNKDGHPLGEALRHGFLELALLLIEKGAVINSEHIFWANEKQSLEFLIKQGADINHFNDNGQNKLMKVLEQNVLDLIPTLIEMGIDIYATDKNGLTALHQAASVDNYEKIIVLLPYYDLEKCNQIYPLDSISNENNTRILLGLSPR